MITQYANKGNCRASYATGSDRLLVGNANTVDVMINGAKGRMILDTGASLVSITPSFAARARILVDESHPITVQVVGGTIQSALGYAQLVEVGGAQAANVPVVISTGNDAAYGSQVDGLLGMTFLARFNVTLAGGALELKPRLLN
jgi:aspartyl protease family protein